MSDPLPELPKRSKKAHCDLTGAEVGRALAAMGVSPPQFCRLTGTNEVRLKRQIRDNESELPLYYEIALYALYISPVLRTLRDPIPLPFAEWGIDIVVEDVPE
jgi:hypothetical protein